MKRCGGTFVARRRTGGKERRFRTEALRDIDPFIQTRETRSRFLQIRDSVKSRCIQYTMRTSTFTSIPARWGPGPGPRCHGHSQPASPFGTLALDPTALEAADRLFATMHVPSG